MIDFNQFVVGDHKLAGEEKSRSLVFWTFTFRLPPFAMFHSTLNVLVQY